MRKNSSVELTHALSLRSRLPLAGKVSLFVPVDVIRGLKCVDRINSLILPA